MKNNNNDMKNNKFRGTSSVEVSFEETEERALEVTITTERLYLTSITTKDSFPLYSEIYGDPQVMEKFASGVTRSQKETEDRVAGWIKRWNRQDPYSGLCVTKQEDDKFIGQVVLGYGDQKGESELAYLFSKKIWQQGFGQEAVGAVVKNYAPELAARHYPVNQETDYAGSLTDIVSTSRQDNPASIKILEKCGFKKEGENEKFGHLRNLYKKSVTAITR